MNIVKKFIDILHILSSLQQKSLIEDVTKVTIEFQGKVKEFEKISNSNEIIELADNNTLNFNINVRDNNFNRKVFIEKFKYLDSDDSATLRVNLNKSQYIEEAIVYFFLSKFCEDLTENRLTDIKTDGEHKTNIYLPINDPYMNDFISLIPLSSYPLSESETESIPQYSRDMYRKHIYILANLSSIEDYDFPIPLELNFIEKISEKSLSDAFDYYCFKIITRLLATKNNKNNYIFSGYQTIDVIDNCSFSPKNISIYFSMYEFIYDKEKYFDKLEITRNVFTLYQNDQDTLISVDDNLERINETILDHFSAYVQNSIEKFFNSRKDIVREAYESGIKIREHTDKITQQINLIIIGSITALLSAIVLYSRGGKWFLVIVLLLHSAYFFLSYTVNKRNFGDRGQELEDSFDIYSKEFTTLSKEKIQKIKESHIRRALQKFEDTYSFYKKFANSAAAIVVIIAIVIAFTFNPSNNEPGTKLNTDQNEEITNKEKDASNEQEVGKTEDTPQK